MSLPKSNRLYELDVFRGIASIFVVIFHFDGFKYGSTGVELFFIISGFVILMSIEKSKSLIFFLKNRFIRLYPLYWFCVFLIFFKQIVIEYFLPNSFDISIKYLLANLTMFAKYFNVTNYNVVFWTLTVELQFYLIISFILLLKIKNITNVILSLNLIIIILNLFFPFAYNVLVTFFELAKFLPLFSLGILMYNIYIGRNIVFNYLISIILLSIFLYLKQDNYIYNIIILAYSIIFILFINNKLKFIINDYLIKLGEISYAIYLTHLIFSLTILKMATKYTNFYIGIIIATIFSILLGYVFTFYIEKPIVKKIKQIIKF